MDKTVKAALIIAGGIVFAAIIWSENTPYKQCVDDIKTTAAANGNVDYAKFYCSNQHKG